MASDKGQIVIFGAGFSTGPLVHFLADSGYEVVLASRGKAKIDAMKKDKKNIIGVVVDVEKSSDQEAIEKIISGERVKGVVSMLPYIHHTKVARYAIKHKKHFFTTSYVSDDMKSLDEEAKKAGIILVNECGVDPGTDHMSAMKVINEARANGGRTISFKSYCGGLPAPDCNDNPLGYKFSWAPRGVLLASRNMATFLQDGKKVSIGGGDLFDSYSTEEVGDMGKYEVYPNRNSLNYIGTYGLDHIKTMIRGTYRNTGWCRTVKKFSDLDFLSLEKEDLKGKSLSDITQSLVGSSDKKTLKADVAKFLKIEENDKVMSDFEWLGLFGDTPVKEGIDTKLDALCDVMMDKMQYKPGERDMILMKHEFIIEYPEKKERHTVTSTLVDYGIKNGDTSMSRTVSYPVGVTVLMVLEGKINLTGVQIPTIPEMYVPILKELEKFDIRFVEKIVKKEKMD